MCTWPVSLCIMAHWPHPYSSPFSQKNSHSVFLKDEISITFWKYPWSVTSTLPWRTVPLPTPLFSYHKNLRIYLCSQNSLYIIAGRWHRRMWSHQCSCSDTAIHVWCCHYARRDRTGTWKMCQSFNESMKWCKKLSATSYKWMGDTQVYWYTILSTHPYREFYSESARCGSVVNIN